MYLFLFFVLLSVDCVVQIFPYKFTGALGEIIWIFSKKVYYVNLLFCLGFLIWFLFVRKVEKERIRILGEEKVHFKDQVIPIPFLKKMKNDYSLLLQIKRKYIGATFITYLIEQSMSLTRFKSLERIIRDELGIPVIHLVHRGEIFILLGKKQPDQLTFRHVLETKQENYSLIAMNFLNEKVEISLLNNFLIDYQFLPSIICSILITGADYIIYTDSNRVGRTYDSVKFLSDPGEIMKEIEKREAQILGINMQNHRTNIFLVLENDTYPVEWILRRGKKLGIFVIYMGRKHRGLFNHIFAFRKGVLCFLYGYQREYISVPHLNIEKIRKVEIAFGGQANQHEFQEHARQDSNSQPPNP